MKNHIYRHIVVGGHKLDKRTRRMQFNMIYLGELALVGLLGFVSLMMANTSKLPNNTSFVYPLQKVSTLECRTLFWDDMPESCKINLPIIHGANYSAYQDNTLYRSIYTTLRAASYSDTWNQKIGAHAGLDISTARGTPLYSIGDGEVYSAGWNSAYGNLVRIKYIYNGEVVYGVYAHMDAIEVKTGQKVSKGQRVGTVGNTGNTSGALGGYHVHFEIAKDSFGRPAYAYTNCPDLSKGHYKIIQNGLCRTELVSYQYDPIRILEGNSTYIPPKEDGSSINDNNSNTDNNGLNNNSSNTSNNTSNNSSDNTNDSSANSSNKPGNTDYSNNHSSPNTNIDSESSTNKPNNSIDKPTGENSSNNSNVDSNNSSSDISNNTDEPLYNSSNKPGTNDSSNNSSFTGEENIENEMEKDPLLVDLDFSKLRNLAEHFSRIWDIEIRSELKEKNLMLGETALVEIEVFKKGQKENRIGNYFDGVLQLPFMFISSNDVVSININSLQLITKGKAKIELTANKVGKSTLIIEIDDTRVGKIDILVK